MTVKRDNEQIAHDILCVAKYGSPGGMVYTDEVKRMQRYLEGVGVLQRPVPRVPTVRVAVPPPAITVRLP